MHIHCLLEMTSIFPVDIVNSDQCPTQDSNLMGTEGYLEVLQKWKIGGKAAKDLVVHLS